MHFRVEGDREIVLGYDRDCESRDDWLERSILFRKAKECLHNYVGYFIASTIAHRERNLSFSSAVQNDVALLSHLRPFVSHSVLD